MTLRCFLNFFPVASSIVFVPFCVVFFMLALPVFCIWFCLPVYRYCTVRLFINESYHEKKCSVNIILCYKKEIKYKDHSLKFIVNDIFIWEFYY